MPAAGRRKQRFQHGTLRRDSGSKEREEDVIIREEATREEDGVLAPKGQEERRGGEQR